MYLVECIKEINVGIDLVFLDKSYFGLVIVIIRLV